MYKIVCVTNKGKLSNEQMLFISAIQKAYGVHCIFQTERKGINQPRYKRYLRVVKKHGLTWTQMENGFTKNQNHRQKVSGKIWTAVYAE